MNTQHNTPIFPKRAVITNGMPYGDKTLHFGHVGGGFIHSDIYARFLRDRIGKENVIYVCGTDCYGAGSEVKYQSAKENGFEGTLEDFVEKYHNLQKEILDSYGISLNLFAASALEPAVEKHVQISEWVFETLYKNGYLRLEEVEQFFDEAAQQILNGRQVEGRCPVAKCKSEKAYADECEMGHQYSPSELIAPKSVMTGEVPSLLAVKNWYFDLERFAEPLKNRQVQLKEEGISRKFLLSYITDFLKDPAILIKTDELDTLREACTKMPAHEADIKEESKSATLTFKLLEDREKACAVLREYGIRFRTGTTLVPFRLSGNVKWGIPVPVKDGVEGQTFWVWPESLWAPISFVQTYLAQKTGSSEGWERWWFDPEARVYQFIGEDNIYFYAVAEIGLFMALNEIAGREIGANLPITVPNRHVYYGNKKVSSSGAVTPPSPSELLEHYTTEQLRMHFAHMSLQYNSVKFLPKATMQEEESKGFDATLAEGNILTNVYNRLVRSCFYSLQKYFDGKMPEGSVSSETLKTADTLVSEYEWAMYRFEFSKVIDLIDVYLREANKIWSAKTKEADLQNDSALRLQTLIDSFQVVRIAATLLHPFAPEGTERIREFLRFDERLWDWTHINETVKFFMDEGHTFKFLEPRVDFFLKHPSQLNEKA